jgi:tripartite motif-containing protein 71
VKVDEDGFQFVCEFGNSRVQVFDSQDRPVEILGGAGSAPGQMSTPWAVALDSKGNLYVADAGNHRVLKFVRKETGSGRLETGGRSRTTHHASR